MAEYFVDGLNGSDANAGTSEGAPKQTIGAAAAVAGSSKIWVKATTVYAPSGTTGNSGNYAFVSGYDSVPGDSGRAVVSGENMGSVAAMNIGQRGTLRNFRIINAYDGFNNSNAGPVVNNVIVENPTRYGFSHGSAAFVRCAVIGSGDNAFNDASSLVGCIAFDCAGGINLGNGKTATGCIAALIDGNGYNVVSCHLDRCVAYKCSGHGAVTDYRRGSGARLIFWGNGGYGWNDGGAGNVTVEASAFGGNTSGDFNIPGNYLRIGVQTLTADPFVDGDNGDFRLNDVAGGGALLRASGYDPLRIPYFDLPDYLDIGALQTPSSGGGGAPLLSLNDVGRERLLDTGSFAAVFGPGSLLELYDEANPDDPADGPDGSRVAYATLPSTPWASATDGELAIGTVWSGPIAGGDVVGARLVSDDGNAWAYCTVGDGQMLELPAYTLSGGDTLRITGATIRIPPAG